MVSAYAAESKHIFKSIKKEAATQHKLDALQKCTQKYKLYKQREIVLLKEQLATKEACEVTSLRKQLQTQAKLLEDEKARVLTEQQQLQESATQLENEKALVNAGKRQLQEAATQLEHEKALVHAGKRKLQESDNLLQQERLSHYTQNENLTQFMTTNAESVQQYILEHKVPAPVSTDTVV